MVDITRRQVQGSEAMTVPAFSLRMRNPRLRELVREVAAREHISQNELLVQAAEHEIVARGELMSDDLAAADSHLASLTDAAHERLAAASVESFADGEARPELLRPRQIVRPVENPSDLGAEAALHDAR